MSTALFAVGSFLLGLTVDMVKDIVTSSDMSVALKEQITGASVASGVVCVACYGLGTYFLVVKSKQTGKIKSGAVDDL